jgi:hypothetical protein
MGPKVMYGRYVWKPVAIGLVLVAAGVPLVDATLEHVGEGRQVARRYVRHDHAPDDPWPTKLSLSYAQAAGTAILPARFIVDPSRPEVPYRELDI